MNELVSKISQEDASAAIVISTFRGNPGSIQFLSFDGTIQYEIRVESAALRREVASPVRNKINDLSMVVLLGDVSEKLRNFANYIASLLTIPLSTYSTPEEIPSGTSNQAFLLLRESERKIHWSWHLATNQLELGPRLRITHLRSKPYD